MAGVTRNELDEDMMFILKRRIKTWELKLGKIRMPYPQWGIREWVFVILIDELTLPRRFLRAEALYQDYRVSIAFGKYHLQVVLCDD